VAKFGAARLFSDGLLPSAQVSNADTITFAGVMPVAPFQHNSRQPVFGVQADDP
jgi:hypothetical protein